MKLLETSKDVLKVCLEKSKIEMGETQGGVMQL